MIFSGAIYDHFQSYDIPFFLAGTFLILSALIASIIPFISKYAPPKPLLVPRRPSFSVHLEDIPEAREPSSHSNSEAEDDEEHLNVELPSNEDTSPAPDDDEKDEHIIQFK